MDIGKRISDISFPVVTKPYLFTSTNKIAAKRGRQIEWADSLEACPEHINTVNNNGSMYDTSDLD